MSLLGRGVGRALGGLALLAAAGCAAAGTSAGVGSFDFQSAEDYVLGGQTGSLVPRCGVAPLSANGQSVPAGDAVAVVYTQACTLDPDAGADAPRVVSMDGEVSTHLEPLDESAGVYVIVADEALEPGQYDLQLPGEGDQPVVVSGDPAPLPTSLGRLTPSFNQACPSELTFDLTLDDAAASYAPLLQLRFSIDGGDEQEWVAFGALGLESGSARAALSLPRCGSEECIGNGQHGLVVTARIAGEAVSPNPLQGRFSLSCSPPAAASVPAPSPSSRCGISAARNRGDSGLALLPWLFLATLLRRRQRDRNQSLPIPTVRE